MVFFFLYMIVFTGNRSEVYSVRSERLQFDLIRAWTKNVVNCQCRTLAFIYTNIECLISEK